MYTSDMIKTEIETNTATEATKENKMNTVELGNNESYVTGISKNNDGTYTALTATRSKDFKTFNGAQRWMVR